MDFDRPRRFKAIIILAVIYVVTSCLQAIILGCVEHPVTSAFIGSAKEGLSKPRKTEVTKRENVKVYQNLKGDEGSELMEKHDETDALVSKVYVELQSCLPRFICEVHAQPPGMGIKTELEKNILSLFKGHIFLEGPSSPVYSYQLAAHMGQLASGIVPSLCHNMYPSCPLSRDQLLDLLAGVKTSRRSFL